MNVKIALDSVSLDRKQATTATRPFFYTLCMTVLLHYSVSSTLAFTTLSRTNLPFRHVITNPESTARLSRTALFAAKKKKPERYSDNAPGVLYVNDHCINCAACNLYCPESFERSTDHHVVYKQPSSATELDHARAALSACPVAAIRLETKAERRHQAAVNSRGAPEWTEEDEDLVQQLTLRSKQPGSNLFPRPFLYENSLSDVHWLGHHNEASFGGTPYLLHARMAGLPVTIMVDVPRYSSSAIQAVRSLISGSRLDYLFLTHVDDTAGHDKWALEFPGVKRILHAAELDNNWVNDAELENCEILLSKEHTSDETHLAAFRLDGSPLPTNWQLQASDFMDDDVILLHTPGHSPGSMTLYKRPMVNDDGEETTGILFTGDTYAYTTRDGGHMSAFPRYGNDHKQQASSLKKLLMLEWDVIAPGHGHPRDYRGQANKKGKKSLQEKEMETALEELVGKRMLKKL